MNDVNRLWGVATILIKVRTHAVFSILNGMRSYLADLYQKV